MTNVAINADTYGPLKVLCEDAVVNSFHNHLILRPTYVLGAFDYTDRFPEWIRRIARGEEIEAPGPKDGTVQYIDVRDFAAFAVKAIESDLTGIFNTTAVNHPYTFEDFLESIVSTVGKADSRLSWLSAEEAKARMTDFAMWSEEIYDAAKMANSDAAYANGLCCRSIDETTRDVFAWLNAIKSSR